MTMATSSTLSRSFPTLKYVVAPFRWVTRTRRWRWTTALVLLAILAAPVVWWATQLLGLPDVGDQLGLEPSRSIAVPEDRDAVVLYRRAEERYWAGPSLRLDLESLDTWSKAPPKLRRLVEENGEALALYREAAERPDESPSPDRSHKGSSMFHWLALLEASRLQEQGDMAGAWGWYRAVLRTIHHESAYASYNERIGLQRQHDRLRGRLERWVADRQTTPALLRRALDEVIACRSLPPPSDSYTLVAECLQAEYPYPAFPLSQVTLKKWNEIFAFPDAYVTPDRMQAIYDLWRFWHREPERSRRVIRLAIANWLAYHRLPPAHRPPADLKVTGPYDFYALGTEATAAARALSPEALDRWLESSPEAKQFLEWWVKNRAFLIKNRGIQDLRAREWGNDRALLVLLASELYRRDHGTDPPSDQSLVGPYLERLPDDGPDGPGRMVGGPVQ
jgi:hypothetical protein